MRCFTTLAFYISNLLMYYMRFKNQNISYPKTPEYKYLPETLLLNSHLS